MSKAAPNGSQLREDACISGRLNYSLALPPHCIPGPKHAKRAALDLQRRLSPPVIRHRLLGKHVLPILSWRRLQEGDTQHPLWLRMAHVAAT